MHYTSTPDDGASGISVLIPTHNRAEYLRECLQSVLPQVRPHDEVIVVDDGSTDNTPEVIAEFASAVRMIKTEHGGKSAALNMALQQSTRPLVWIIDDDDVLRPDALFILTDLLSRTPEADFAYGRYLRFEDNAQTGKRRYLDTGYWRRCASEEFLVATMEDLFAHQPGMLVRRSLYNEAGPFDESLQRSIDYEMLVRLARLGRAAPTEAVIFHQRIHPGERGGLSHKIEAKDRETSWIENDKLIFRRVRKQFALENFLPTNVGLEGNERRALLQRGVIMGRKKLWELAVEDFRAAARISDQPLAAHERWLIRSATNSKYGCQELYTDVEISRLIAGLATCSRLGPHILLLLARGLLWRIRAAMQHGNFVEAFRFARIAFFWSVRAKLTRQPAELHIQGSASR